MELCADSCGPECAGTCPAGQSCVPDPTAGGGGACVCVPDTISCGQSFPICDGACPVGDTCVSNVTAGGCSCVPDVVTVPPDLNPGDEYRLLFVTSSVTDATSAEITVYNAVVAADAAAVPELDALSTAFTAVASTPAVDALDNTMTDPSPAGPTGVPIYLLNGTRFADDYDSLWTSVGPLVGGVPIPDGTLPFIPTSSGDSPPNAVWTGSSRLGVANGDFGPLGDSDDDAVFGTPRDGAHPFPSFRWLFFNFTTVTAEFPLYGMSGVLTVCPSVKNITQGTIHATIQGAIDAAASDNVIELGACTFFEDNLTIPNGVQLTLQGAGMDQTFIDGGSDDAVRVFLLSNSGQTNDTVIADLTISTSGGAAGVRLDNTSPIFRRVRFFRCMNSALDDRGGPTYDRCVFSECGSGSTLFKSGVSTSILLQCLFSDNATTREVVVNDAAVTLVNCTMNAGIALRVRAAGQADVFNTASTGVFELVAGGVLNSSRSVYPGATGDNIDGVPTFVDAPGGDYRLAPGSLGIDAADNVA